jgi:hypothetical protein
VVSGDRDGCEVPWEAAVANDALDLSVNLAWAQAGLRFEGLEQLRVDSRHAALLFLLWLGRCSPTLSFLTR